MNWWPSIPGWEGIHPAMVHFPIALLLAAPLLLLVSLFARKSWRAWGTAALLVMAVGALAAWLAAGSGHAAGQIVDKTPELERAIARHEALGVTARNAFTALAALFGVLMLVSVSIRKGLPDPARIAIHAVFLILYVGCTTWLVNAANLGGRLVHESGVKAVTSAAPAEAPSGVAQASGSR